MKNKTGLPAGLKAGMESLSGMKLDHVKVHYNSSEPAKIGALAYAQGSNIYLATGQEKHLAHELGHVVQQSQGRVKPTTHVGVGCEPVQATFEGPRDAQVIRPCLQKGIIIVNEPSLEREADQMGKKCSY